MDALPSAFTSLFPEGEVQIGLWLDGDDRPRKMTLDGTLNGTADPLTGQRADIRLKATMTLGDFGKPVQVTAPPADQTTTEFTVEF